MIVNPEYRAHDLGNTELNDTNVKIFCIITPLALTYLSGIGAYYLYQNQYLKSSAIFASGVVAGGVITCFFFCMFNRPPIYR